MDFASEKNDPRINANKFEHGQMEITVLYVGSSLLAPLKRAEREINRAHRLNLKVAAHNFGAALSDPEWSTVEKDLANSEIVFVIHVMDGENASRLLSSLEKYKSRHRAVIVINCMPELMRRTKMGRLEFSKKLSADDSTKTSSQAVRLLGSIGSWIGNHTRKDTPRKQQHHGYYLNLVDRLPGLLKLIPTAGKLRDVKHYLFLFCYFIQPTPANIRSMLLYALKHYVGDDSLRMIKVAMPEAMPTLAIYHPDAPKLFESFEKYQRWYQASRRSTNGNSLDPNATIGLLLMRPQVVSKTTKHYDKLIRAIEAEGLSVIPALSTLMDNREACQNFFIRKHDESPRVSQILSLTGFSFVGGPAMNDSESAREFLVKLDRPYRSAVSLDMQTIDAWTESLTGLNPVQLGMQVAIPEIDGATEPYVFGGIPSRGLEPEALEDRCERVARRVKNWNHLRVTPRNQLKIALVLFCFPPTKGNIGTAADLDVFASVHDTLIRLKKEGYQVEVPKSADALRNVLLSGNSESYASNVNIAYRMSADEYRRLCPFVRQAENDWGSAPGRINSFGTDLLIQGVMLGNVFVGVQPTFGYEGDPMRLMMARSGSPHHGFLAFYTYLQHIFKADAVVHVGTHGALEFMPGKQVGLSQECWPDRLIGELPHVYLYSVNNPSEGSIAKRRSYAELISYLTPPIENAGLYRDLLSLKELVTAYRQTSDENEKQMLFESIQTSATSLNLTS
jgi:magnesium chelatase subunit H